MRFIPAVFFLIFLMVLIIFAVQNAQTLTIQFLKWEAHTSLAFAFVAVYVLGMLSGWTVVAYIRRSIRSVTERRRD
jgi:uncharacterized integral membrane protein